MSFTKKFGQIAVAAALAFSIGGTDIAEARNNEGHNFGRMAGDKKEAKTSGGYKPGDKGPPGTGGTMITPHKDRPSSLEVDRYHSDVKTGHFEGKFSAWRETQRQTRPTYGDDGKVSGEQKNGKMQRMHPDSPTSAEMDKWTKETGRKVDFKDWRAQERSESLTTKWSARSDRSGEGKHNTGISQIELVKSGRAGPGLY